MQLWHLWSWCCCVCHLGTQVTYPVLGLLSGAVGVTQNCHSRQPCLQVHTAVDPQAGHHSCICQQCRQTSAYIADRCNYGARPVELHQLHFKKDCGCWFRPATFELRVGLSPASLTASLTANLFISVCCCWLLLSAGWWHLRLRVYVSGNDQLQANHLTQQPRSISCAAAAACTLQLVTPATESSCRGQ
jgi:hypothetical protein